MIRKTDFDLQPKLRWLVERPDLRRMKMNLAA
jgi:hypothetical protein